MSHILKEYSKNLEVRPSKPHVNKHYYPIVPDKYIVIYNEQSIPAKTYRYYSLVIDLIKQTLSKSGVSIVMIGEGSNLSDRADYIYPNLNFRQNAYIISNSLLFVCIDNALSQYASSENVKTVCLYGNIYSSITTPYWSRDKNKIDLEPEWASKPCLSLEDPEDSINKIKAEDVASSILKLLNNNAPSINFKTKLINKFSGFSVDVIPLDYKPLSVLEKSEINIRLDRGAVSESALLEYLSRYKCNIYTKDSLIQPELIERFVNNISSLKLILTEDIGDIPKQYFSFLSRNNIDVEIIVLNEDILDDIRFKFFDQNVHGFFPSKEKPSPVSEGDRFFSFKLVIQGDKVYKSTYHWKKGIDNCDKIVDNADYWEELDYFYIYEQDRT